MRITTYILLLLFVNACHSGPSSEVSLSDLPVYTPSEMVQIDSFENHYFRHIGYESVVLENGAVLIPDRSGNTIYNVSVSGELMNTVLSEGRGPAEIQDITFLSQSVDGSVLVYDQRNQKVVLLDSLGNYSTEFITTPWNSNNLSEIYEMTNGNYIMFFRSLEHLFNRNLDPVSYLVIYDPDQESYSVSRTIFGKQYAPLLIGDAVAGGAAVPYSPETLRGYDRSTGHMFVYDSDSDKIVQISETLDTLRVIQFNAQPEQLSDSEIDTVRVNTNPEMWDSMSELLPEYKAMADKMLIGQHQDIWLKLNHASEYQQWLVVSGQGEKKAIVNLPKDVMLTHISEHHLGVRLDDVTFALYEPVDL